MCFFYELLSKILVKTDVKPILQLNKKKNNWWKIKQLLLKHPHSETQVFKESVYLWSIYKETEVLTAAGGPWDE